MSNLSAKREPPRDPLESREITAGEREILATLQNLVLSVDEVRTQLARIEVVVATPGLSAAQRELALLLLPALGGWFGTAPFRCRDAVSERALGTLLSGRSAESLGKLLAACVGLDIDGWTVRRDRQGWIVGRVLTRC